MGFNGEFIVNGGACILQVAEQNNMIEKNILIGNRRKYRAPPPPNPFTGEVERPPEAVAQEAPEVKLGCSNRNRWYLYKTLSFSALSDVSFNKHRHLTYRRNSVTTDVILMNESVAYLGDTLYAESSVICAYAAMHIFDWFQVLSAQCKFICDILSFLKANIEVN